MESPPASLGKLIGTLLFGIIIFALTFGVTYAVAYGVSWITEWSLFQAFIASLGCAALIAGVSMLSSVLRLLDSMTEELEMIRDGFDTIFEDIADSSNGGSGEHQSSRNQKNTK